MKILAIVPARSGSKSIKDKNIIDVNGKPLLAYSVETAVKLKSEGFVDKVIISTDSQKYASIASKYGAEAPFLRPANISGDKAKSIDFILHSIDYFDNIGEHYEAVMLLQPTSPLRNLEIMRNALKEFSSGIYDSALSCYKEEYVCDLVSYKQSDKNNNTLIPVSPDHNKGVRRQDHDNVYVRNGCVYITTSEYLKSNRLIISDNPMLIEMSKVDSINIDTLDDLELLNAIYAYRNNRT